jgi:HK97 family phage prohead protease
MDRVELRDSGDDNIITLEGYASTFEQYDMYGGPANGGWIEQLDTRAFERTLKEKPDLHLLINHAGMPLARTKSGTLQLSTDDHGLKVVAQLDKRDPEVQALAVKMERGDLDEMSFAFRVKGQKWEATDEFPEDPEALRTITEVSLHKGDVSVVNWGANPTTSAGIRSASDALRYLADCDESELVEARADDDLLRRATAKLSADGLKVQSLKFQPITVAPDEGRRAAEELGAVAGKEFSAGIVKTEERDVSVTVNIEVTDTDDDESEDSTEPDEALSAGLRGLADNLPRFLAAIKDSRVSLSAMGNDAAEEDLTAARERLAGAEHDLHEALEAEIDAETPEGPKGVVITVNPDMPALRKLLTEKLAANAQVLADAICDLRGVERLSADQVSEIIGQESEGAEIKAPREEPKRGMSLRLALALADD